MEEVTEMKKYILMLWFIGYAILCHAVNIQYKGFYFDLNTTTKTATLTGMTDSYKSQVENYSIDFNLTYNGETYYITAIGDHAFAGANLRQINLDDLPRLVKIDSYAFSGCTNLTHVWLPESLERIEIGAFLGCENLYLVSANDWEYKLPGELNYLGSRVFMGCRDLKVITIAGKLKEIPTLAFAQCTKLPKLEIKCDLEKIADNAFQDCTSLATFELPLSVSQIGNGAFSGCTALKDFYCVKRPFSISNAFTGVSAEATLHVPYGAMEEYANANNWNAFKNIVEYIPANYYQTPTKEGEVITFHSEDNSKILSFNASDIESIEFESTGLSAEGVNAMHFEFNGEGIPRELEHYLHGSAISFSNDGERMTYTSNGKSAVYPTNTIGSITNFRGTPAARLTANADVNHPNTYHTTFYSGLEAYSIPANVKAYTTRLNRVELEMTPVEGSVIPRGEAVVLYSNSADITLEVTDPASATASAGNEFRGVDVTAPQHAGTTYYEYAYEDGKGSFLKMTAEKPLLANVAYFACADNVLPTASIHWNDAIHHNYANEVYTQGHYMCSLCSYIDGYRLNERLDRVAGENVSANTYRAGRADKFAPVVIDGVTYTLFKDYQYAPIVGEQHGVPQTVYDLCCVLTRNQAEGNLTIPATVTFTDEFQDVPVVAIGEETAGKVSNQLTQLSVPENVQVIEKYSYLYHNGAGIKHVFADWTTAAEIAETDFSAEFTGSGEHFLHIPDGTANDYRESQWVKDYGFRMASHDFADFKTFLLAELGYAETMILGGEEPRKVIADLLADIRQKINELTSFEMAESTVYPLTDSFFPTYRLDQHVLVNEAKQGVENAYLNSVIAPYLSAIDSALESAMIRDNRDAALAKISNLLSVYNTGLSDALSSDTGANLKIRTSGGVKYDINTSDVKKIEFYKATR